MPSSPLAGETPALIAALAILAASAIALAIPGESEAALFGLCFAGVLAGALLGLPRGHLAAIGAGIALVCWAIVIVPSPHPRLMGVIAHFAGGALLAWVLAEPARQRWPWMRAPPWSPPWLALPLLVLIIGGVWELAELGADAAVGTDLSLDKRDTVLDLSSDLAGALAALAIRDLWLPATRSGSPEPDPQARPETGR